MTNARIRLIFAGVFTIIALLSTLVVVILSVLKGLSSTETLAILGPFAVITSSGVTFFLGHQNGISEVSEKIGRWDK